MHATQPNNMKWIKQFLMDIIQDNLIKINY